MDTHSRILRAIAALAGAAVAEHGDRAVERTAMGDCLVGVQAGRTGLASLPGSHGTPSPSMPERLPLTVGGLAAMLAVAQPHLAPLPSLALAAANALLAPPPHAEPIKGQDLILAQGRGRRVAVVGHFPFVERLAPEFAAFDVLELNPRPGDLPASAASDILPRAQVAALTGSSLVNGTLGGLLDLLAPEAFVILLGPSTPFASCLFDFGVDALAGAVVDDAQAAMDGVAAGRPFRGLGGVRSLVWLREKQ